MILKLIPIRADMIFMNHIFNNLRIVVIQILIQKNIIMGTTISWFKDKLSIFERKIENYSLGGVGNLSINLKSLGIKFDLFSEIGKDNYGKKVLKILREKK